MKKFLFQSVLLILLIAGAIFVFRTGSVPFMPFGGSETVYAGVIINEAVFKAEVADTQEKRNKGLGGRQSLERDEGMLFVFPESGRKTFWMKGLKFSLDFIWIREDKVVDLLENVPPPAAGEKDNKLPVYEPKEDADKVLEVNAGTVQKYNIKVGDSVQIQKK